MNILQDAFKYEKIHDLCLGGDNLGGDDVEGLNAIQKAILVGLCMKTKGSKAAHLPKHAFMNKPQIQGRKADKALRELVAFGYIKKHPTGGETTYELNDRGFDVCRKLREKRKAL